MKKSNGHYPEAPRQEEASSPFIHEFFMVQCAGLRCMAYLNDQGQWRGAFDDREIRGKVLILE